MRGLPKLALLFAPLWIACSSAYVSDDPPPVASDAGTESAPDGGACTADLATDPSHCGACGRACGAAETCTGGACVAGCRDGVIRVAPDGDDAASGCAGAQSKKTIHAALAFARTTSGRTREIHVCVGSYTEPRIVLDVPVALLGGYGCATFARLSSYGYPTFGAGTETMLTSGDAETLVVSGAAVDGTRVDGFVVRGSATSTFATTTVLVREGAKPVLSNMKVLGTDKPANTVTSVALRVESGAAPEIERTLLDGGNGSVPTRGAGSVALVIAATGGATRIRDSAINGGRGRSGNAGAVGIYHFADTQSLTIERTTIDGGAGATTGVEASERPSQAASVRGPLTLTDSVVRAGSGTCGGSDSVDCQSYGMVVSTTSTAVPVPVRIARSRFYGGDAVPNTSAQRVERIALAVYGGAGTIANNLIHLGGAKPRRPNKGTSWGITVRDGKDRLIAHNTITAVPNVTGETARGNYFIDVDSAETDARVLDNILLGTGSTANDYGVALGACRGASLAELKANLFVGFTSEAGRYVTGTSCAVESLVAMDALESRQNALRPGSASANSRLAPSCVSSEGGQCLTDSSCSVPYPGCIPKAVAFDAPSFGVTDLDGAGWLPLLNGPVCAASRRSVDLTAVVPNDIALQPRAVPVSIGAHEVASCP